MVTNYYKNDVFYQSSFWSHSSDCLWGQIFFQIIRCIVFNQITSVSEGDDCIGYVLTEDYDYVSSFLDQFPQDGVGDFLDLCSFQMGHHPWKDFFWVKEFTCIRKDVAKKCFIWITSTSYSTFLALYTRLKLIIFKDIVVIKHWIIENEFLKKIIIWFN